MTELENVRRRSALGIFVSLCLCISLRIFVGGQACWLNQGLVRFFGSCAIVRRVRCYFENTMVGSRMLWLAASSRPTHFIKCHRYMSTRPRNGKGSALLRFEKMAASFNGITALRLALNSSTETLSSLRQHGAKAQAPTCCTWKSQSSQDPILNKHAMVCSQGKKACMLTKLKSWNSGHTFPSAVRCICSARSNLVQVRQNLGQWSSMNCRPA